jgi:hypothetical protein
MCRLQVKTADQLSPAQIPDPKQEKMLKVISSRLRSLAYLFPIHLRAALPFSCLQVIYKVECEYGSGSCTLILEVPKARYPPLQHIREADDPLLAVIGAKEVQAARPIRSL